MEVQHIGSLTKLIETALNLLSPLPLRKIPYEFALHVLSIEDNHEANRHMNNLLQECGCFAGGLFMGLSVIAFVVYLFTRESSLSESVLKLVGIFVLVIIGSTLTGKLVGLVWARFRMIIYVAKLIFVVRAHKQSKI